MTDQGDQTTALATAVADLLFRLTTTSMRLQSRWPAGRISHLDQRLEGRGTLRSARAKRCAVWRSLPACGACLRHRRWPWRPAWPVHGSDPRSGASAGPDSAVFPADLGARARSGIHPAPGPRRSYQGFRDLPDNAIPDFSGHPRRPSRDHFPPRCPARVCSLYPVLSAGVARNLRG